MTALIHGTLDAYKNHRCRCGTCATASFRYEKRRKYLVSQGLNPTIPAHGFKRRVQALMCIGWTAREIAEQLNIAPGNLARKIGSNTTVRRETHVRMCEIYERLSMTIPADNEGPKLRGVTRVHARTRGIAIRRGFLPPLAWDDIDDPDERPNLADDRKDSIDEAAIERVLAGDIVPTTHAERVEITRRWQARGRSLSELERRTGWKSDRYTAREQAAS